MGAASGQEPPILCQVSEQLVCNFLGFFEEGNLANIYHFSLKTEPKPKTTAASHMSPDYLALVEAVQI